MVVKCCKCSFRMVDSWPATPLAMFPVSHLHETNVREVGVKSVV